MPSIFLRKIRTRRLVKAAEKRSGLKHEKSIFRGSVEDATKTKDKSAAKTQYEQPMITMTVTEDSDSSEVLDYIEDQQIVSSEVTSEPLTLQVISPELSWYACQIKERDATIQQMTKELDSIREDDVDVILDLAAKQQEIAALTGKLEVTEAELSDTKRALMDTKDKLCVVTAALMQTQNELHDAQQQRNVVVEGISKLGQTVIGYWK